MNRRETELDPKDLPLRDDVRWLGTMLGELLVEQEGADLYTLVEEVRQTAIARRQGDPDAKARLEAQVNDLDPRQAELLTRAFSFYFQLVNLAERVHRIRRRRYHDREGAESQPGSIRATLTALAAQGMSADEARRLLERTLVEPVFTAHPTEASRRTLLTKHQRIARALVGRLDPSRTPAEDRSAKGRIRGETTTAWQTQELSSVKPKVADEVEHVLFYVTDIFYRIVPALYESIDDAMRTVYDPSATDGRDLPCVLRFASWVGGDMDGNPFVGPDTIATTLERQRDLIVRLYIPEVRALAGELSQSIMRVGVDGAVIRRHMSYTDRFPDHGVPARYGDMPYRVLLRLMARRLEATAAGDPRGYRSPRGFIDDLDLIRRSLEANKGAHAGVFRLKRLLRRAQTFGFHLVTLDVRQDAMVHRTVIGKLLGEDEDRWLARPAAERAARIRLALDEGRPAPDAPDDECAQTLAVFATIRDARERYGAGAIGPYIISMAQTTEDVLAVMLLAQWSDLVDPSGALDLDIAPLFETVPDLRNARATMSALFDDARYRAHLVARGDRQVVMIGYSDSNKEGGLVASRWAIQRGQADLVEAVEPHGVQLTLFHGKGGTVSRGGGNSRRAILASPRGAVTGGLRMTEQGEVINAKYGVRGIAMRNLELTLGAVLERSAANAAPDDPRLADWGALLDELAQESRQAYRALVYDTPGFTAYFRAATPIDAIERLRIGSRPASRRKGDGVENLRAIPWVFAWTQSRHLLPGWFGLGTGLSRIIERHGQAKVAELATHWPFFQAMLTDVEVVLATADMAIAHRYAALAGAAGAAIFDTIRAEFDRTKGHILSLLAVDTLLANDRVTQRSIALRNPYVDPMSLLQLDLLQRWRATGREDETLEHALLITLNGIAHGLRSTG